MPKKVIWITSSNEDKHEALRHAPLGDVILAFVYPVAARRVSSTFFCPALRIVAIDEKKRSAIFDQVIQPSRFVVLPASRLVLQMDPGVDYLDQLPSLLVQMNGEVESGRGQIETEVSASALVFALFADALADLRRVKSVCLVDGEVDPVKLKHKFAPWERGQIVGSAGFIVDYISSVTWRIPDGAVELAHEILQIEKDYHDELMAASAAGIPWQREISNKCIRCEKGASWRFVLPTPAQMAPEIAWRLERPENAVPLCRDCAETLRFATDEQIRRDLVWALWGARFDALERWYNAVQKLDGYRLPKDWLREQFPLWPKEFGGNDWASGSGAAKHSGPAGPADRSTDAEAAKDIDENAEQASLSFAAVRGVPPLLLCYTGFYNQAGTGAFYILPGGQTSTFSRRASEGTRQFLAIGQAPAWRIERQLDPPVSGINLISDEYIDE